MSKQGDAGTARQLDAAREAVARAIGGLAGRHDPTFLMHAVAYFLGGMVDVHALMTCTPAAQVAQEVAGTVAHGAICSAARRQLRAVQPAGHA